MTATRVDGRTGVEESVMYMPTPRGLIYAWIAHPPGARSSVVICSSIFADFANNYHRERLLGRSLAARGYGVIRFHYIGEGNSEGDRSNMTFSSLCEDTHAAFDHGRAMGMTNLAVVGTRVGATVAAASIASTPSAPLVLWEPALKPVRLINEGNRAKLMSQIANSSRGASRSWKEELRQEGVLDLIGYDVYSGLAESLDTVDLVAILGQEPRPVFIAGFQNSQRWAPGLAETLIDRGFDTTLKEYDLNEVWWMKSDNVPETGALVSDTVNWLSERLDHGDSV